MENRIISEFKGLINNIEIKDESNYNSTLYILEKINEKFGEKYNDDFIKDLSEVIQTLYIKYDEFSYSILENDFRSSIEEADNFNDIKFEYYGSTWKIDTLNEKIKEGEYVKDYYINRYLEYVEDEFGKGGIYYNSQDLTKEKLMEERKLYIGVAHLEDIEDLFPKLEDLRKTNEEKYEKIMEELSNTIQEADYEVYLDCYTGKVNDVIDYSDFYDEYIEYPIEANITKLTPLILKEFEISEETSRLILEEKDFKKYIDLVENDKLSTKNGDYNKWNNTKDELER